MSNIRTNSKSSYHIIPIIAIGIVLFLGLNLEVVQAQYYDLRIGTERYYNEEGAGVSFPLMPTTGIRDNPIYLFERVIDEVIINDTTWAVVEIDIYRSSYSPSYNGIYTINHKDTVYQRMDRSRLIEYKKGEYSVLMDFNLAVNDSIDIVLENYTADYSINYIRENLARPIVFVDTTIAFPNGPLRRIIYGGVTASGLYEFNMSVSEFIENMVDVGWNIPIHMNYGQTVYINLVPYYYIDGAGVMFSIFSQRKGMFMIGYKPIDGLMLGEFEVAPVPTSLETGGEIPNELAVRSYPNPFNPTTTLEVNVPESGQTQIHIYNKIGQNVARLHNGTLNAGIHRVPFDAGSLSSGVYIVRVIQGELMQSHKVLLLK